MEFGVLLWSWEAALGGVQRAGLYKAHAINMRDWSGESVGRTCREGQGCKSDWYSLSDNPLTPEDSLQ